MFPKCSLLTTHILTYRKSIKGGLKEYGKDKRRVCNDPKFVNI